MSIVREDRALQARNTVQAGFDLLDRVAEDPMWVFEIDLDTMSLASTTTCMAAQFNRWKGLTNPGYSWPAQPRAIIRAGGFDPEERDEFYFGFDDMGAQDRASLEDWWKLLIDERRAELS